MDNAVVISYAALIAVVGAVSGAIGVLFRALLASKDAEIADLRAQRDLLMQVSIKNANTAETLATRALP